MVLSSVEIRKLSKEQPEGTYYIYIFVNLIDGKQYIGQTIDIYQRYYQHKHCSQFDTDENACIDRALHKHGFENFLFEPIFCCLDLDAANEIEPYLIELYGLLDKSKGYNVEKGGKNAPHEPETRKKISGGLRKHYEEFDSPRKGIPLTEEHKRNLSIGSMGKPGTNTGKPHSEEWRDNLSKANAGRIFSQPIFTPDIENEICKLYLGGLSANKLSDKYDCKTRFIVAILDKHNIEVRQRNAAKQAAAVRRKFSDDVELEMCELYKTGTVSMADLGRKYCCKNNVARAILLRNGISLKRK